MSYLNCNICGEPKTDNKWCKSCNSKRFKGQFENWTSENEAIDNFIKDTQLNAMSSDQVLEWVLFEKEIFGVEFLAEGGYGSVYNAKWRSGHIKYYDDKTEKWRRSGETEIILKSPDKSITPNAIIDLINSCWDKNPEARPKAIDLRNKLSSYKEKNDSTIWNEIDEIEKNLIPVFLTYEISDQAYYTSRLLP
ncbi:34208_t:CDS:2 [Gigaspora margarita]|uniref:34208_t:CDS:1 n=1 Tax=Gigaspora margarita TaxID=4874 RepID=A0ABM8VW29_GIGMA|nr:34208_t:CDS:2 [Gigaspora margarita]